MGFQEPTPILTEELMAGEPRVRVKKVKIKRVSQTLSGSRLPVN